MVEQIDRLTANIDLSEASSCSTLGVSNNTDSSAASGDIRVVLLPNHQPSPVQVSQHAEGDRIILRTNAPSPVHTACVVKTSRFTPPSHSKDVNHEKPSVNGHPPHLNPYLTHTPPEARPHNLEPKVIIGNSTRSSGSRTQKPPPYPQNGRCCKAPYLPPKPVKTPAYPGRGRQSTSIVWRRGGGLPQCHGGLKHETLLLLRVAVVRDQAGEQLMVSSHTRRLVYFYSVAVSVVAPGWWRLLCVYWQHSFFFFSLYSH